MTDPAADFVALSLVPINEGREAGERLRAGEPPSAIVDRWLADRLPFDADRRSILEAQAAEAIRLGAARGLTTILWSDAAYPPALAAIVDPPPLLWTRGSPDARSEERRVGEGRSGR